MGSHDAEAMRDPKFFEALKLPDEAAGNLDSRGIDSVLSRIER
jgi:hypothetical protein